ncbi:hypothetical protein T484DRAFT_2027966 [Baffinella frigidus]|nr:hypothetical protein T484DRAFT_2027966 [Cryptophyta sp. CCMP2293]
MMVHSSTSHDAAFAGTTRSSGYPSSLLLLQLRVNVAAATTWSCKQETTVSSRKAAGERTAPPPLSLECIGAPKEGEAVKTPTLNSVDAWHEMYRRFDVAHDPAARASSDSDFFESARLNVNLEEAETSALSVACTPTSSSFSANSSSSCLGRLSSRPHASENSESEMAP